MLYIQHGYGKSNKIQRVADEARLAGVILSPAHEDMHKLAATADDCRSRGLEVLLDPQSYIYSLSPQGFARKHAAHQIEFSDLHWSQTADTLNGHVDAVLVANQNIGNKDGWLVAPAPHQANLTDYWMPAALQYGRTSAKKWGSAQTIATIVIDENVLRSWDDLQRWLDPLTTLDVAGFYLLVNRKGYVYPGSAWDADALANLLRVIYTLTEINDYKVIWGYSDIEGLLGLAAGASAIASGWSQGLRFFSTAKWNETQRGSAANPRVYLPRLWTPVRDNEAEDLLATAAGRAAFMPRLAQRFDDRGFGSWDLPEAQVHHLSTLARVAERISSIEVGGPRLDTVSDSLHAAIARLDNIAKAGLTLERRHATRVKSYRDAIDVFRKSESL